MNLKQGYVLLRRWLKGRMQARRNRRAVYRYTNPGSIFFEKQVDWLLDRDESWLAKTAAEYRACSKAWQYLSGLRSPSKKTDGFAKSLDVAEGFALWALVKHVRPKVVVELGVQYGVSARLWKEALKAYVPEHELILCDLEDKRRLIDDDECTFLRVDARQVLPDVFSSGRVGILHNDAHPYDLIYWSVDEALKHDVPVLTFHDVGRGPRSSFKLESSRLSKEQKLAHAEYSAEYGHWERHVIAEIFDHEILHKDSVEGEEYRIQIFDSLFGFGVVLRD
jgi:hypothetical protein